MRKFLIAIVFCLVMIAVMVSPVMAKKADINTITKGEVNYSAGHYLAGEAIPTGYDSWGYNYQGHMFSGTYANIYLGGYGYPPYNGDDAAYYQRLVDEGIATDLVSCHVNNVG